MHHGVAALEVLDDDVQDRLLKILTAANENARSFRSTSQYIVVTVGSS